VGHAALVEHDAGSRHRFFLAVLEYRHGTLGDVKDVRRVVVFVSGEFGSGPEREDLDQHVVGHDELLVDDFTLACVGYRIAIERHGCPEHRRVVSGCGDETSGRWCRDGDEAIGERQWMTDCTGCERYRALEQQRGERRTRIG